MTDAAYYADLSNLSALVATPLSLASDGVTVLGNPRALVRLA